ncbi:hypothetical protein SDC9_21634 [bioreactor metagenome]|uniref:Uncharacterized protein n=1 Tax=bioreactor metagenome TaxID=1076179 RepID=A0A644UAB7_9ZZZZ
MYSVLMEGELEGIVGVGGIVVTVEVGVFIKVTLFNTLTCS